MDIRAFHKPTKTWRWAVMGRDGSYARVDPQAGERLEDFRVHEVIDLQRDGQGYESFRPATRALRIPIVYS